MLNKTFIFSLLFIFSFNVSANQTKTTSGSPLQIKESYIPAAPPVVKVMAAYMTVTNTTNKSVEITSITSNVFGLVEMHETLTNNGMMSMQLLPTFTLSAKQTVKFTPGGKHLMLFRRSKNLTQGDKVNITLHTTAGEVTTQFIVKEADDGSHHHHNH